PPGQRWIGSDGIRSSQGCEEGRTGRPPPAATAREVEGEGDRRQERSFGVAGGEVEGERKGGQQQQGSGGDAAVSRRSLAFGEQAETDEPEQRAEVRHREQHTEAKVVNSWVDGAGAVSEKGGQAAHLCRVEGQERNRRRREVAKPGNQLVPVRVPLAPGLQECGRGGRLVGAEHKTEIGEED